MPFGMYHGLRLTQAASARCWPPRTTRPRQLLKFPSTNCVDFKRTMGTDMPVQKRAVAGTFLFRFPEDGSDRVQVALFRRSGQVRAYQHKLAPISGSVEDHDANPLATALREIKEETTLDLTSIELLRTGKPYSFTDDDVSREWTINPFAFRLKSIEEGGRGEAGIVMDWEHTGWEWHDPLAIKESDEFGGVPKLVDSLRRVWPEYDLGAEAAAALTDGLQSLRQDQESNAPQVAEKAVSVLKNVILKMDWAKVRNDFWWLNVRMTAWHLCQNGREDLAAAITSSLVTVLGKIEAVKKEDIHNQELRNHVLIAIDAFRSERDILTDASITNEGNWSANEINEDSEWIGRETERLFGNL